MMVQTRQRRNREFTGPTPNSVAILAREPGKKSDAELLMLKLRAQEQARKQAVDHVNNYTRGDRRSTWERITDNKIQVNLIKQRVSGLLQVNQFDLEERKERLRKLLLSEEQKYLEEMAASEETVLERQAKMREKAKQLKERREQERQDFVQQKLKEQWRNQCEELRGTLSKRFQDQVAAERTEQLRQKEVALQAKAKEEQMFADLWYADMMAKAQREEEDAKRQMSANKDTVQILQYQMAALEAQKQEEQRLKEEEAEILKEENELRKLEEQRALEEKRRKQQETRAVYDRSLRIKQEKVARELQEQLAFDMKMLEQLLQESHNEAMEQAQRKKELREETRRYREYLKTLQAEESRREIELDRLCDAEVEKMWEKRVKQWKLEKEARRKLLQEVMETRREQLQEKLNENMKRQAEAAEERENILRKIEENKQIEADLERRVHIKNKKYQHDLISQMHYNQSLRNADLDEKQRMWQAEEDAEREYQAKLEEALNTASIPKLHPMRKWAINKNERSGGLN